MTYLNRFYNFFSLQSFLIGINRVLLFFGLRNFKFLSNSFRISYFGVFIMILNFLFNISQIHAIFANPKVTVLSSIPKSEKIVILISTATYLLSFISSLILIVLSFIFKKKIFKMFKSLEKFDRELLMFKVYVNDFRDVGLLALVWIFKIFTLISAAMDMYPGYNNPFVLIFVFVSVFSVYISVEIFIGIIYLVNRRIFYITSKLRY